MATHADLAERWSTFTIAQQLANVGSDVDRAIAAWEGGARRADRFERALARALELFDLTAGDERWRGHRRREILRAREEFCRLFFDDAASVGAARSLQRYFLHFAVLSRQCSRRPETPELVPDPSPRIPRRDPSELLGAAQCWVCLQLEDAERTQTTHDLVALVGAAEYAVCVRCGQEALECKDEAYRARARRYVGSLAS